MQVDPSIRFLKIMMIYRYIDDVDHWVPQKRCAPQMYQANHNDDDIKARIGLFEVDAIGDDDDLSHVYLPNFKQLQLGFQMSQDQNENIFRIQRIQRYFNFVSENN